MSLLSYNKFLKELPDLVLPAVPAAIRRNLQVRQPFRAIIQFYDTEPRLHYEVGRAWRHPGLELGFHFESRDKALNRKLLLGFRRHLFEVKDNLGEQVEAEMWDRGWSKVYEVLPASQYTTEFHHEVARRMAQLITTLHPIYTDILRHERVKKK